MELKIFFQSYGASKNLSYKKWERSCDIRISTLTEAEKRRGQRKEILFLFPGVCLLIIFCWSLWNGEGGMYVNKINCQHKTGFVNQFCVKLIRIASWFNLVQKRIICILDLRFLSFSLDSTPWFIVKAFRGEIWERISAFNEDKRSPWHQLARCTIQIESFVGVGLGRNQWTPAVCGEIKNEKLGVLWCRRIAKYGGMNLNSRWRRMSWTLNSMTFQIKFESQKHKSLIHSAPRSEAFISPSQTTRSPRSIMFASSILLRLDHFLIDTRTFSLKWAEA